MSRQATVSGVGVELACAAALLVFVGLDAMKAASLGSGGERS